MEEVNDPVKQEMIQQEAKRQAERLLRKNKKELKRLRKHAEKCLEELNTEGYIYAIGKIRKIIKKPLNRIELEELYESSVEKMMKIALDYLKDEKK